MTRFTHLKRFVAALAVCGSVAAYSATPAEASFVLRIDDDGTCTDTVAQANCDVFVTDATGPPYDPLIFIGAIGNFYVNVASGVDLNPSSPTVNAIDLTSINVSNAGGGTLFMELSGTGFDDNSPLVSGVMSWLWGGTVVNGVAHGRACKGVTDQLFSCQINGGVQGPFAGAFATGGSVGHPPLGLYSMYIAVQFTAFGEADYSGNFRLQNAAVPEPGSMFLLGTGLVGLARTARRRLQKGRATQV